MAEAADVRSVDRSYDELNSQSIDVSQITVSPLREEACEEMTWEKLNDHFFTNTRYLETIKLAN